MPLYKTITPNSQTTVKIWKITESYDDLMTAFNFKIGKFGTCFRYEK